MRARFHWDWSTINYIMRSACVHKKKDLQDFFNYGTLL